MKKLILSVAVVIAAISVNAQKKTESKMDSKFKFSVGVEAGIPVGDLGDVSSFIIGGSVQGDYWVDPMLAINLNAGYQKFTAKNSNGLDLGVIPVLAGIKAKFGTSKVYGSAQLGVGIFTGGGSSTSAFGYAPGIGYSFTPNFDALVKYQAYSKNSSTLGGVNLRLAYTFGN